MPSVNLKTLKLVSAVAAFLLTGFLLQVPAAAQGAQLEEVIVTAQKRAESVQDVPIAVSAYSEGLLLKAGIDDIREIANLSPSFQVSSNVSETQGLVIRIRGIGTQGNNPAFESAVGVFIDGVYRSRAGAALSELLDIERIEVLRGPQGTLFGRNTSAGALSIITAGPEQEFGGYIEATYGNLDEIDIRGSVTGPIVEDKLSARISALYRSRDGVIDFIDNNVDRNVIGESDDKDRVTVKGQFLFEPNDRVSLRVIGDYRRQREDCCYPVTLINGIASNIINFVHDPGTQVNPARPFDRQATSNRPTTQEVDDWGMSAELNVDFDDFTVTAITAFRDFESFRQLDIDFTDADLLYQDRTDRIETFTGELRAQGEAGIVNWLVGVFYSDEKIALDSTLVHGAQYEEFLNTRIGPLAQAFFGADFTGLAFALGGVAPGTGWADGTGAIGDEFVSNNTSFSIFTHNVVTVTERLDLIIGFRYNIDDKHAASDLNLDPANTPGCLAVRPALQAVPNLSMQDIGFAGDLRRVKDVLAVLSCLGITSPAFDYDIEQDNEEWSGTFGVNFRFNDDVMAYGTFSRGYKAGGINLDRAGTILTLVGDNTDPLNFLDPSFEPELVNAYEVGMKSTWFDNRMNLNISLFWQDIKNFQLNTFTGFNFTPENVEKARTAGVEVEIVAAPLEGLQVMLGATYAKTDYGDNITDRTNVLTNDRGFRTGTQLLPTASPLAGRQLTNAPRWVVTGAFTYTRELPNSGGIEAYLHADFRYSTEYNTGSDLDIEKLQDDFVVVNARLGVGGIEGDWRVDLWVKNLFDKDYQQVAFDIPLQANDGWGSFLADPRTYGITGRLSF